MRYALMLAACSCLWGQGTPIYTNVGPLSCGLRLYSPGQVQEYCLYAPTGGTPVTVCNAIHQITPVAVGQTLPIAASQSCFATDPTAGQNYEVTWLVFEPIVALPANSTGTVQYQIATTQQACAMNTNGVCVATGAAPIAGVQSGSFPSGVVGVAEFIGVQVGNSPPLIQANSPHAQWNFAASPGPPSISVISTDGYAYAVGDFGACTVTSSGTGLAEFLSTAGGVKVAWLPDGWCPGGLGLVPATVTGDCSLVGLSMQTSKAKCNLVPSEKSAMLAGAIMSPGEVAPVIQGQ